MPCSGELANTGCGALRHDAGSSRSACSRPSAWLVPETGGVTLEQIEGKLMHDKPLRRVGRQR
ncbi:hypothetical protein [Fulvimonas yonginensis]|uniref:Uncharacterized protein n=1 Tax=Fulvimonas yonginensis TaxID=1495200 RepID=A0ABU8J7Q2_9GAMM